MSQRTTTWPAVPTSQNGSGAATSRVEQFDNFGNSTWSKDERGFITHQAFDLASGAMPQRIEDCNGALITLPTDQ